MNYENEGHRPDGDDPRYSGILHSESWLSGYIVLFAAFELVALIDEFFAATEHLVEVGVDELEILLLVVGFVVGHVGLSGGVDYESVDAVFAGNDYELLVSLCAGDLAEHLSVVDSHAAAHAEGLYLTGLNAHCLRYGLHAAAALLIFSHEVFACLLAAHLVGEIVLHVGVGYGHVVVILCVDSHCIEQGSGSVIRLLDP